jgi:hypothetical protein
MRFADYPPTLRAKAPGERAMYWPLDWRALCRTPISRL